MKFPTVAVALALACGLTAPIEAKQKNTTKYSKPAKAKKLKFQKYKPAKYKASKFKPARAK